MPEHYLYKKETKKLLGANETLYVRPLQNTDVHPKSYLHWFTDKEVCKYNSHRHFSHDNNYKHIDWGNRNQILWAVCIERGQKNKHIGNVSLKIDWANRKAEFACIFGDRKEWGKGYATYALNWMIQHGFHSIGLNRIWLGTPEQNLGMIKVAEKAGMIQEGTLINDIWMNGQYINVLRYGITKNNNE